MTVENPWLKVIEYAMAAHLGERAQYYDLPAVAQTVKDRVGFLDPEEIDPVILEDILDQNRKTV